MRILLTPQAVSDIENASSYFTDVDPELSARFNADIDAVIARIELFPKSAAPVEGFSKLRRARTRRFPYGLFYEQTEDGDLLIVRVLHSRRHYPDAFEA